MSRELVDQNIEVYYGQRFIDVYRNRWYDDGAVRSSVLKTLNATAVNEVKVKAYAEKLARKFSADVCESREEG